MEEIQRTFRVIAALFMLALGSPLLAQQLSSDSNPALQQSTLSLDEAAVKVRERTGGQILSAKEYRSNGDHYYRFKLKNQGRVRVLYMRPDGSTFKPGS